MSESLYDELGGKENIEAVVNLFYDRVENDERVADYFNGDTSELRDHMTRFLCSLTGGPVEYEGRSMRKAHAHLNISSADFAAIAENLQQTLEDAGVGEQQRQDVLEAVAGFEDDIVTAD